jgi:hypothetical protein
MGFLHAFHTLLEGLHLGINVDAKEDEEGDVIVNYPYKTNNVLLQEYNLAGKPTVIPFAPTTQNNTCDSYCEHNRD